VASQTSNPRTCRLKPMKIDISLTAANGNPLNGNFFNGNTASAEKNGEGTLQAAADRPCGADGDL